MMPTIEPCGGGGTWAEFGTEPAIYPVSKAASDGGVFIIFLGALSIAAAGELSVTEVL